MEQFKQTERDSKTKAFSKEGLSQPDENDEKSEYWNWLSKSIKELNTQTELLEVGKIHSPHHRLFEYSSFH